MLNKIEFTIDSLLIGENVKIVSNGLSGSTAQNITPITPNRRTNRNPTTGSSWKKWKKW